MWHSSSDPLCGPILGFGKDERCSQCTHWCGGEWIIAFGTSRLRSMACSVTVNSIMSLVSLIFGVMVIISYSKEKGNGIVEEMAIVEWLSIVVLDMATWLYTPWGVEKGSCLNRPSNDVFLKSVKTAISCVTDYKQHIYWHLHLHWYLHLHWHWHLHLHE